MTVSFGLGLDLDSNLFGPGLDSDSNLFGLGLDSDSNLFGLGLVLDSTKVDLTTALAVSLGQVYYEEDLISLNGTSWLNKNNHNLERYLHLQSSQWIVAVSEDSSSICCEPNVHKTKHSTIITFLNYSRAVKIIKDSTHPGNHLFCLLPSGRRFRSMMAKTERLRKSFFPQAIRLLNTNSVS